MPPGKRSFGGFEDLDERAFDPALKIPPLQYPIPLLISRRPSPLEPDARVDDGAHRPTNRLDSRSKGPVDSKKIGDEDPLQHRDRHPLGSVEQSPAASSFADGVRKRQKLDLIQLPKPSTRSSTTQHPSFASVPVLLNKLNEPPPSAALFPPITTILKTEATPYRSDSGLNFPSIEFPDRSTRASDQNSQILKKEKEGKQKRVYHRARLAWTIQETNDLLKGVEQYGVGKWKGILHDREFKFHPDRTMGDLKDRYRTCRLNRERTYDRHTPQTSIEKVSNGDLDRISKIPGFPNDQFTKIVLQKIPAPDRPRVNVAPDPEFNISTPEDFRGQESTCKQRKIDLVNASSDGKHLPRWTPEEDANLFRGYQKYGFGWTTITKDPEMSLGHRTGPQVRDRFRLKYPRLYQSSDSIQLQLPDGTRPTENLQPALDSGLPMPATKVQASHRQGITLLLRESSKSPTQSVGRSLHKSKVVEVNGATHGGSATAPQPLKNTPNIFPPTATQEAAREELSLTETQQVTPPASLTLGDRSRQTSIEVEIDDRRNSNMDDLLNGENDRQSRLPPFKFPFDNNDWGVDAIADSVILPPLLWDDVTSRPLFDFE